MIVDLVTAAEIFVWLYYLFIVVLLLAALWFVRLSYRHPLWLLPAAACAGFAGWTAVNGW